MSTIPQTKEAYPELQSILDKQAEAEADKKNFILRLDWAMNYLRMSGEASFEGESYRLMEYNGEWELSYESDSPSHGNSYYYKSTDEAIAQITENCLRDYESAHE
jgi:hypothetical protein